MSEVVERVCPNCGVGEGEVHLPGCTEGQGAFVVPEAVPDDDGDVSVMTGGDPGREYVDQDDEDGVALSSSSHPGSELDPSSLEEIEIEGPDPRILLRAMRETTELHEFVAQVAHEVNRAYSGGVPGEEGQHLPWDQTHKDLRDSTIAGVRKIFDNPSLTSKDLHDAWMQQKIDDGWAWGPTKNFDTKRHPNIRPYSALPPEQRLKDDLFRAVCLTFLGVTP